MGRLAGKVAIVTVLGNPTAMPQAQMNRFYAYHPIPRSGWPQEVAHMAVFPASDEASYCTGSEYPVDSGWHAGLRVDLLPGA